MSSSAKVSVAGPPTDWPESRALFDRATEVMPGGNTRTQLYVPPGPVYVRRGEGVRVELDNGWEVTDFLLNYTAAAVGYSHPSVLAAIEEPLAAGPAFGAPTEWEVRYAEALAARIPALERVRFANSGSEATLHAIRVARAVQGRSTIAKAEGAYHGSHDLTDYSVYTVGERPLQLDPQTSGMPEGLAHDVVLFPYNDLDGTVAALAARQDELAAVIVETYLNSAGIIAATRDYLSGLARWCHENGVLLILDEVASFRTAERGAGHEYGIEPDLICLGKALGGGFAFGAFGGRAAVMDALDPRRPDHVRHAGTFNGHPVTMAAGMAVLEILDPQTIAAMNRLGERLVAGIQEIGRARGLPLTASGVGSVGSFHVAAEPPRNGRDGRNNPKEPLLALYWRLLERGYMVAPRGQFSVSSETEEEHVDGLLEAIDASIADAMRDASAAG